ncbi:MAG: LD-carboxypeptidase [Hyphomicrobiaceae bacterium]|nr:LD-carboxypeptidase [Hyphomicrobiaceae bacterium]
MNDRAFKIGVVAPGSPVDRSIADRVTDIAASLDLGAIPEIHFHPQCFTECGHFAGNDATRVGAFVEIANNPEFDAIWFARGGYGSCRLLEAMLPELNDTARAKTYLGYSDVGAILGALYAQGFERVAHGPMAADVTREGGEATVERALRYLVAGDRSGLEPTAFENIQTAAFNISILSHLLGTPQQPDLSDHILMLEEVSEYMYRIDRYLFHITSNPEIRKVAGIKLGRCSDVPENDRAFGHDEEQCIRHWCERSGIPYLGRADIGHDIENKIVPFGNVAPALETAS